MTGANDPPCPLRNFVLLQRRARPGPRGNSRPCQILRRHWCHESGRGGSRRGTEEVGVGREWSRSRSEEIRSYCGKIVANPGCEMVQTVQMLQVHGLLDTSAKWYPHFYYSPLRSFQSHDADGWLMTDCWWFLTFTSNAIIYQVHVQHPSCSMCSFKFAFISKLVPCAFLPPGILLYSVFFNVLSSNVECSCWMCEKEKKRDK